MNEVIGIKQQLTNQIVYIKTDRQFEIGDFVVIDCKKGEYIYECVRFNEPFNEYAHALQKVSSVRLATSKDLEVYANNQQIIKQLSEVFINMTKELNVNAMLVGVELSLCKRHAKYTYYSAENLQFANMIKYLLENNPKRVKIEFYQVAEREYYAIAGGIGVCGYELCCHGRSHKTPIITTNMLKELKINMSQKLMLSGTCSKYKCCLLFDHRNIESFKQLLPDLNETVFFNGNEYCVVDIDFSRSIVTLKGADIIELEFEYFIKEKNDSC